MEFQLSDIPSTPKEFFEKLLPSVLTGMVGDCREGVGSLIHVLEDGAVWSTWLEGGRIVSSKERRDDTLVEVTCVSGSWREIVTLGKQEHAAKALSNPRTAAILREAKGTLLRKIIDRGFVYGNTTGGATPNIESPDLILEITMEDHFRMNAGEGTFLLGTGRANFRGDFVFLADLAAAFE